jgi:hypothetical protein
MNKMNELDTELYIVGVNKTEFTKRLFIRLNDRSIFYFGDDVTILPGLLMPNYLLFKRTGDDKDDVHRILMLQKHNSRLMVVERIRYNKTNKEVATFKYPLSRLITKTKMWDIKDNSFWGEYRALDKEIIAIPTFPDLAEKVIE